MIRIWLAGNIAVESEGALVREERLPGLQGRVVFAMLAAEHARPVSRDELVEELWGDSPPPSWETALRAIVSKLRGLFAEAGLAGDALAAAFGAYQLHLPTGSWIDVEAAAEAIHIAEPALRKGNIQGAVGFGRVADAVAMRPFLVGADGPWAARRREQLREIRLRALDCLAQAWLQHGDANQAARDAEEALRIDPFREPTHRLLLRALAEGGNRAGALQAFERFRTALAEELGVDPAAETEALYVEILRWA